MTPEQLRIYNSHRLKRGLTPLKDDSDVTTFTSEYSNVLPYITGLQTETDDPEYAKNIKQELDWISNSTHYLFDAVDAGVQAYQEAIAAGKTAQEAIEDAAQAASDAGKAAQDAQDAANKAQAAADTANQAITDATNAGTAAYNAQVAANNAQNDINNAQAVINANTQAAAAANSAAAAAAQAAADGAAKAAVLTPKNQQATSSGTNFINVPASSGTQYLVMLGAFGFYSNERSYLQFHMNGLTLNWRLASDTGWRQQWDTGNTGDDSNHMNSVGLTIEIPAGQGGMILVVDTANRGANFSVSASYSVDTGGSYNTEILTPCIAILTQANSAFYQA